ncbi:Na-translocating system protein MpsC family protein [Deferrisoma palaeochoriense]
MPYPSPHGPLEDEIAKALVRLEKEYMGRGPKEAWCRIVGDMVVVRLRGVLTPAEIHLARTEGGIELVKRMRTALVESARSLVVQEIEALTGCGVVSVHTDISTRTGERVFVFTLDAEPQPASGA